MELNQWLTLPKELCEHIAAWVRNGDLVTLYLAFGPGPGSPAPYMQISPRDKQQRLWVTTGFTSAVCAGDLPAVKYLHRIGIRPERKVFNYACSNGHLEVARYLYEKMGARSEPQNESGETMAWACFDGFLHIVRFLHDIKLPYDSDAMMEAARHGHMPIVQFLHSVNAPITAAAMNMACGNGQLEVVKYLHTHRLAPYSLQAITFALSNGHDAVVKYICETTEVQI